MNVLKKMISVFLKGWEQFWFTPVSTSCISVFRILLGMLLIQDALLLCPDLYVWFGKDGIVSPAIVNGWQTHIRLNILNLFPNNDVWLNIVFAIFVISAITLTIGFNTRLSAILAFVCLSSLHARNYLILNSGDVFMRMLCFWLIFSAAGMSLSIDRLRKRALAAPWAQRIIQINLSLLYAHAFVKKITGADWQNGTAVYFSSRMIEMQRFHIPFLFDQLWTCRLLSWAVLGIEFSLFTFIWVKPLRYYVLIAGLLMHLAIDWTMNIPQFEWIMMISYILFVEPDDMDKFINRVGSLFTKLVRKLHFRQATI